MMAWNEISGFEGDERISVEFQKAVLHGRRQDRNETPRKVNLESSVLEQVCFLSSFLSFCPGSLHNHTLPLRFWEQTDWAKGNATCRFLTTGSS